MCIPERVIIKIACVCVGQEKEHPRRIKVYRHKVRLMQIPYNKAVLQTDETFHLLKVQNEYVWFRSRIDRAARIFALVSAQLR